MTEPEPAEGEVAAKPTAGRRVDDDRVGREPADELPWVDDRASKIWVALIVGVFGMILLYGILLGDAGVLTPVASPTPATPEAPISTPTGPARTTSPASPTVLPSPRSPVPSVGPSVPASPAASPPAASPPDASPSPGAS